MPSALSTVDAAQVCERGATRAVLWRAQTPAARLLKTQAARTSRTSTASSSLQHLGAWRSESARSENAAGENVSHLPRRATSHPILHRSLQAPDNDQQAVSAPTESPDAADLLRDDGAVSARQWLHH